MVLLDDPTEMTQDLVLKKPRMQRVWPHHQVLSIGAHPEHAEHAQCSPIPSFPTRKSTSQTGSREVGRFLRGCSLSRACDFSAGSSPFREQGLLVGGDGEGPGVRGADAVMPSHVRQATVHSCRSREASWTSLGPCKTLPGISTPTNPHVSSEPQGSY